MTAMYCIEVDSDIVDQMESFGFLRVAHDGIHELTPVGKVWLRTYCAEQMRLNRQDALTKKKIKEHPKRKTKDP